MPAIEIGRVCIKTRGRNAGKEVVIVGIEKNGFVLIEGKGKKKKKCNIRHLLPTQKKVEVKKKTIRKAEKK